MALIPSWSPTAFRRQLQNTLLGYLTSLAVRQGHGGNNRIADREAEGTPVSPFVRSSTLPSGSLTITSIEMVGIWPELFAARRSRPDMGQLGILLR